jgi:hypothetical protein
MALLRRAPREVYRVFSETDFLAEGDAGELFERVTTDAGGSPPLHRIAGVAMLVGVVAAVGAMLIMHGPQVQTPRPSPAAPAAAGTGAPAGARRVGSAAASMWSGSRELPRKASVRRPRVVSAARPGPLAPSVRAPVERSDERAGSPTQLEQAEFTFER